MSQIKLTPVALTSENFKPFGDVIETDGKDFISINSGHAQRFNDLATVDVLKDDGKPLINIFAAVPYQTPIQIKLMERHPLASQAFMPMTTRPYLIVVAEPCEDLKPEDLKTFITNGHQGVNYARNVWHHPLLVLGEPASFVVVDQGGDGNNYGEILFGENAPVIDGDF